MWDRLTEKRNQGGFTLIELLIVIVILAILAAIVVFAVGNTGQNAKNAACSADAKTFETALESYKAEVGSWPTPGLGAILTSTQVVAGSTVGPFIRELPSTTHYEVWTDGSGGVYIFPPTTGTGTPPTMNSTSVNNFDGTGNPCGQSSIVQ